MFRLKLTITMQTFQYMDLTCSLLHVAMTMLVPCNEMYAW
jgi:hypothetical protein